MKRVAIGFVLLVGVFSPGGAMALNFAVQTNTIVSTNEIQGWARGTGVHKVLATNVTSVDLDGTVKIQVDWGELYFDDDLCDDCGTNWLVITQPGNYATGCYTQSEQDPCVDGVWETDTQGRLQLGGSQQTLTKAGNVVPITCPG